MKVSSTPLLYSVPLFYFTYLLRSPVSKSFFTVSCLVKGYLKLINVSVYIPVSRRKACAYVRTCMCACTHMPGLARTTGVPVAASSRAVSSNLLGARSGCAGPAQLLCMLSTKQISLEWGAQKKNEGSICSFLLHCADARLR